MKRGVCISLGWMILLTMPVQSQGYVIYDQVSPIPNSPPGGAGWQIQSASGPPGQSFTPSLASMEFIELWTQDGIPGNARGAGVYIVLRSDSISGPIIASTAPVFMEDGFGIGPGVVDKVSFFFPSSVSVTPGTTYYFQPVAERNSDSWVVVGYNSYRYPGGTAFWGSKAQPGLDMWFRTGIVIPEPSSLALGLFGLAVLASAKRACADGRQVVGVVVPPPPESPTPTRRRGA